MAAAEHVSINILKRTLGLCIAKQKMEFFVCFLRKAEYSTSEATVMTVVLILNQIRAILWHCLILVLHQEMLLWLKK